MLFKFRYAGKEYSAEYDFEGGDSPFTITDTDQSDGVSSVLRVSQSMSPYPILNRSDWFESLRVPGIDQVLIIVKEIYSPVRDIPLNSNPIDAVRKLLELGLFAPDNFHDVTPNNVQRYVPKKEYDDLEAFRVDRECQLDASYTYRILYNMDTSGNPNYCYVNVYIFADGACYCHFSMGYFWNTLSFHGDWELMAQGGTGYLPADFVSTKIKENVPQASKPEKDLLLFNNLFVAFLDGHYRTWQPQPAVKEFFGDSSSDFNSNVMIIKGGY